MEKQLLNLIMRKMEILIYILSRKEQPFKENLSRQTAFKLLTKKSTHHRRDKNNQRLRLRCFSS